VDFARLIADHSKRAGYRSVKDLAEDLNTANQAAEVLGYPVLSEQELVGIMLGVEPATPSFFGALVRSLDLSAEEITVLLRTWTNSDGWPARN
jgi:hypothetical protein